MVSVMPIEILTKLGKATEAAQRGDKEIALRLVREVEDSLTYTSSATNLDVLGMISNVYQALGEWWLAASKLEELCEYASKIHPNTTQTAGDYFKLVEVREKIRDYQGALDALNECKKHLKGAKAWRKYRKTHRAYQAKLHRML